MKERLKLYLINIVCVITCLVFAGIFIYLLSYSIRNDRAFRGAKEDGGAVTLERTDYVKKTLHDIHISDINTVLNEDIQDIMNDTSLPDGIKNYFRNFEEFYKFAIVKEKNYKTSLTTESFIKNSEVIKSYFAKDSKEDKLSQAAIVPYYFIKKFNVFNKKQKKEKALYKEYIDSFVSGRAALDIPGANVLCLYVYSCYDAASKPTDYASLKAEVEFFLEEYKEYLNENGDMKIQRNYLIGAQEILRKKNKSKGWLPSNRIQPFTDF